ncbi:Alpha/Beta hydrolase protein [Cadophora sp. MPI-SDFR-AT-0126]|nr:Alpha/Beta hydrolase protein [Leotiomycetes sp. MPI-SDFR-AT-0126]
MSSPTNVESSPSPTHQDEEIPLPNKQYTIPSTGHTYAYIYYPAKNVEGDGSGEKKIKEKEKGTLLWLHGFPSTSAEWRHQIPYFLHLGYGILAPDLLGYGETSKPLNINAYIGKSMAAEIVAIIDHEQIRSPLIAIGHDWGTYLLSRLATFHGDRFEKFVFMSVPFTRPGVKGDVHAVNGKTRRELGYEVLGYQVWFAEDGEAGRIMGENWESFFNIIYPSSPLIWTTSFAPLGSLRHFLLTSTPSSTSHLLAPWISPQAKDHHHQAFRANYDAPLMWYKRGMASLGWEDERRALERGEIESGLGGKGKRVLMVAGLRDTLCDAGVARRVMRGCVEGGGLKCVDVDAGHWIMLEKPGETNEILRRFFEGEEVVEGTEDIIRHSEF